MEESWVDRTPDYEILSGGGSIAKLPPELLDGADRVVAEFIDELTKKEKSMAEASFDDIRAGDLVRVARTRGGVRPVKVVLEAEAGELIWPEDESDIHWTTRLGGVLVHKDEWFIEQKIEILERSEHGKETI